MMNKGKMISLVGRITHLFTAMDKALQCKPDEAKAFLDDFLSITKQDIDQAFNFLIPECREVIWRLLKADQELFGGSDGIENLKRFEASRSGSILHMLCELVEG
jgi:hypothetical protein